MLILAGKKYAKNESEFVDSLFESGGTCQGFYKRVKNGIQIFDHQKQLRAFIVDRQGQANFIVSAHMTEGKARYMFSTCSLDEQWLGISGMSYSVENYTAKNAIASITNLHT